MKYKCLDLNEVHIGEYQIVPIRSEDKYLIMKWRNEQIYHLRQNKVLTFEDQDLYFSTIIHELFNVDFPNQLLFSFLKNGVTVGYGGLVHINWQDKNAEISFLMDTTHENSNFENYWITFLSLLEQIAFTNLKFKKIYTYSYDLRPKLYPALVSSGFNFEARLIQHLKLGDNFIDIVIYSKINY